ncbi:UNVERIFIED_CONTAM: hypothetical protein NCL1_48132 [Trichonephila clavipes]
MISFQKMAARTCLNLSDKAAKNCFDISVHYSAVKGSGNHAKYIVCGQSNVVAEERSVKPVIVR